MSREERALREILDNSRDVIYRIRLSDQSFEYVSPSCEHLTGFTPAEILTLGYRGALGRVHPDDRARVSAQVPTDGSPPLPGTGSALLEFRFLHRDGQYRWCGAALALVRDAAGQPVASVGTVQDIHARRQAELELAHYRGHLEDRIAQRTQELTAINERLRAELTERARAEAALRESEERFRQLAENIREIFWLTDIREQRTLYVSPAFRELWSYASDDVYRSPDAWISAVDPADQPAARAHMEAQAKGHATDFECRLRRPDGSWGWVRNRGFPIRDAAGHVYRMGGLVEDVTERKQQAELLRIQRDLAVSLGSASNLADALQRVLQATLQVEGIDCGGVYLRDETTGVLQLVSHENLSADFVRHVSSYPSDSLPAEWLATGRPLYFTAAELPEFARAEGLRVTAAWPVLRDGRPIGALNLASRTRDGLPETVRQALEAMAGHLGPLIRRIQVETALRASERLFRTLAETIPAIILIGQGDRTRYVNSTTSKLLGFSAEELLAAEPWAFTHPDMRAIVRQRTLSRQAGALEPSRYDVRVLDKWGHEHWMDLSAALIDYEGQPAALVVAVEVTERKRAEEATRQHQEQLAHVARVSTLGEMVSGVAHDLAQPLSAILYFAKAARQRLDSGTWGVSEANATLDKIAAQAERAGQFIRGLKAFVRKAQPVREPTDLNLIVREALAFAAPEARRGGVTLHVELSDGLPKVTVDRIQIEQVVLNLVHNAIEALHATPPDAREIYVSTYPGPAGDVCVRVHDTGPGVPADVAARGFAPFHTSKPAGSGLGLSISRTLIEEMHLGRLWFEPAPKGGAIFSFSIPGGAEDCDAAD